MTLPVAVPSSTNSAAAPRLLTALVGLAWTQVADEFVKSSEWARLSVAQDEVRPPITTSELPSLDSVVEAYE